MDVTLWLFLNVVLAGPPQTQVAAVPIRANFDTSAPAPQQSREPGRAPIDERPHSVGVGSAITASSRGVGGATRLFFTDRIGVDLSVGWSKPVYRGTTGSIFQATPSFMYMLRSPDDLAAVDIRPYVGGGFTYINSSYRSTFAPESTRTSGFGGQAFLGAELTFKDAQWVTISLEGRYYRLPIRVVNANMIDGMNFVMMFHFFVN
jgi:hypothetical protein